VSEIYEIKITVYTTWTESGRFESGRGSGLDGSDWIAKIDPWTTLLDRSDTNCLSGITLVAVVFYFESVPILVLI